MEGGRRQPERSGLLLTAGPSGDDGLLQTRDIYSLHLDADLVTLSACETALGQNVTGDLALRTQLDPQFQRELQQYQRSGQSARGNILGNAPGSAEAELVLNPMPADWVIEKPGYGLPADQVKRILSSAGVPPVSNTPCCK